MKGEGEARHKQKEMEEQGKKDQETTSSPITPTEFERVVRNVQEKQEKVKSRLLKIKVKAQCVKALVEERKRLI